MPKLLVNTPSGEQRLEDGIAYFEPSRILWNTDPAVDGPLPNVAVGGLIRVNDTLVFDQAKQDEHDAAIQAEQTEIDRKDGLDTAMNSDTTLNDFKTMTNAEFNTWWAANVTTSAQAIAVLKRLARLIIRRVL